MTLEQVQTIRCAYLDLKGAIDLIEQDLDLRDHDWDAVELTLAEMESAFSIELEDLLTPTPHPSAT
jgi:hypothetical protein